MLQDVGDVHGGHEHGLGLALQERGVAGDELAVEGLEDLVHARRGQQRDLRQGRRRDPLDAGDGDRDDMLEDLCALSGPEIEVADLPQTEARPVSRQAGPEDTPSRWACAWSSRCARTLSALEERIKNGKTAF